MFGCVWAERLVACSPNTIDIAVEMIFCVVHSHAYTSIRTLVHTRIMARNVHIYERNLNIKLNKFVNMAFSLPHTVGVRASVRACVFVWQSWFPPIKNKCSIRNCCTAKCTHSDSGNSLTLTGKYLTVSACMQTDYAQFDIYTVDLWPKTEQRTEWYTPRIYPFAA